MNFIQLITKLFGNKAQKDMREVMPYVEKIKVAYEEIDQLSDDALRGRSQALMAMIQERVGGKKQKISELKASIEGMDIDKREKVYDEVDSLEKQIKEDYKNVLLEILPEAFAIVKSTARREPKLHAMILVQHTLRLIVVVAFRFMNEHLIKPEHRRIIKRVTHAQLNYLGRLDDSILFLCSFSHYRTAFPQR